MFLTKCLISPAPWAPRRISYFRIAEVPHWRTAILCLETKALQLGCVGCEARKLLPTISARTSLVIQTTCAIRANGFGLGATSMATIVR